MRNDPNLLFFDGHLGDSLEKCVADATSEVERLEAKYLLQVSESDLVDSLVAKHKIDPITIQKDHIYVMDPEEISKDVPRWPMPFGGPSPFGDETVQMKGVRVTVVVPFDGDPKIFKLRPATYTLNAPRALVQEARLLLRYEQGTPDPSKLKNDYENDVALVEQYVGWGVEQINRYNQNLPAIIQNAVRARKDRLGGHQGLVATLNLPLKRRTMPETYSIPVVRRKPQIGLPKLASSAFKPEPALAKEDYEYILNIVQNVRSHPNCKKDCGRVAETQFRFLFYHRDDRNREFALTVLAFNMPVGNQ